MNMQLIGLIALTIVGGCFLYSLFKPKKKGKNNKKKQTKKKKDNTVQGLFEYKSINDKGISQLEDGTFTAILEVSEINQRLNSGTENTAVWRKFRSYINSMSIRQTLLVQSQYLNLTDFVNNYDDEANELKNLTPQLIAAKDEIVTSYREFSEVKTKEIRCYVIFRFNPYREGIDKSLDTGSAVLNSLIESAKAKTSNMSEEEAIDLASSILDEITELAYQLFNGLGIKSVRLNRTGVLNMVYTTLNRDLAVAQRLQDAARSQSFSEFKFSETPYVIEELAQLEQLKSLDINISHTEDDAADIKDDEFLVQTH